jgi:hypothetical protein
MPDFGDWAKRAAGIARRYKLSQATIFQLTAWGRGSPNSAQFKRWLIGGAAAVALIAAEFWLIHLGHEAVAATVLSLTIGFFVVVYQIGRQAQNALKQSRENEAIKLKLEVYKDITGVSREALDAIGDKSPSFPAAT